MPAVDYLFVCPDCGDLPILYRQQYTDLPDEHRTARTLEPTLATALAVHDKQHLTTETSP